MTTGVKVVGKAEMDHALSELAERLKNKVSLLVGVPSGAGKYDDGLTIATVAAVNEFGSTDGTIPARPFLHPAIAEGAPVFRRLAEKDLPLILRGKMDYDLMYRRMGAIAVGLVQQKITEITSPPNAPSTIAAKKSSKPLIDTGALRQSINYVITREDVKEGIE